MALSAFNFSISAAFVNEETRIQIFHAGGRLGQEDCRYVSSEDDFVDDSESEEIKSVDCWPLDDLNRFLLVNFGGELIRCLL